jgi:hypothetical protein
LMRGFTPQTPQSIYGKMKDIKTLRIDVQVMS